MIHNIINGEKIFEHLGEGQIENVFCIEDYLLNICNVPFRESTLQLFDLKNKKIEKTIHIQGRKVISSSLSPDEKYLSIISNSELVTIIEMISRKTNYIRSKLNESSLCIR